MYNIYENIITEEEQNILLEYIERTKQDASRYSIIEGVESTSLWLIDLPNFKEIPLMEEVINRVHVKCNVIAKKELCKASNHRFGSGILYAPRGSELEAHLDVIDKNKFPNQYMLRMNIMLQKAERGGQFYFDIDGQQTFVDIPDRALITFNATKDKHGVSTNLGSTPRIILIIDCIDSDEEANYLVQH